MRSILYFFLLTILAAPVVAAPITYQGQLQQQGQVVDGTPVTLEFRLFNVYSGGSALVDPIQQSVTPQNGLFQVELDFGAGAFDGSPRFLEILVNGTPLGERQAVMATPQALIATTTVAGAIGTTQINAAEVQRRVNGSCLLGQYIQTVNQDGTVVCGAAGPAADLTQEQVTMLAIWADRLLEGGLNNPYIPGSTVEGEIESALRAFNTSWIEIARFTPFLRGGDIRTEFKIRVNSALGPGTVEAQIRINGAPAGAVHSTSSESLVTFTDSPVAVSPHDVLSLHVQHSASDVGNVMNDFRILVSNPTDSSFFEFQPRDANEFP